MSQLIEARHAGRNLIRAVVLFSIFVNLLMLTGPLFMLQVYDRVLGSGSEETLVALFLLVGGLYALMAILDYSRGRVLARFGAQFQSKLDADVFKHSLTEAVHPATRAKPAQGLRDIETLQQLFTSPALLALCDLPWTPFFVVLIFVFHSWLGWLAVAGGGLLVIITLLNHRLSRQKTLEAQSTAGMAASFAEEARGNAELVQSQAMTSSVVSRWLQLRFGGMEKNLDANDITGLFSASTKSFRLFLQSAMLALGAYLVLLGEMTAGAMIAGSILLGRALAPIEQSIGSWPLIQRSQAAWKTLSELLDKTEYTQQPKTELPKPEAQLLLKNVSLFVPNRSEPVLGQINLQVSPGEALGIIGKSGAGKSSLARILLGLSKPSSGEVRLNGAHLSQYDNETLGKAIGYLPQQVTLFPGTIAENIARLSESVDEQALIAAAQKAHCHDLIVGLADGYNAKLGKHDALLSGGQMQRVGLARALYSDPSILILDEPNSALDADGTEALNRCIRSFKAEEKAVILMTHRPMAIAECDRLIVMDRGRIVADGPRDDVLKSMVKNAEELTRPRQTTGAA